MSIKIKSVKLKPIEMGNGSHGKALGYFRKFSLSTTAAEAKTLRELVSGLKIYIDLSSLEIPNEENNWIWYNPENASTNKITNELRDQIISTYKQYLDFEVNFENPEVDDRKDIHYAQQNEKTITFGYGKNPSEDDPLVIWNTIDIRDLDQVGEIKEIQWRNYECDENDRPLGIEQRWEKEFMTPAADHDNQRSGMQNIISGFLPGYSISFSFECQLEGEIPEE